MKIYALPLLAALALASAPSVSGASGMRPSDAGWGLPEPELMLMADNRDDPAVRERWESLPPEKRKRLEDARKRYDSMPPEERERIKKRYERFRDLPPEKQDRLKERLEKWRSMTPEERAAIEESFERFRKLPDPRKQEIRNRLDEIRALPKDQRKAERRKFRDELKSQGIRIPREERRNNRDNDSGRGRGGRNR